MFLCQHSDTGKTSAGCEMYFFYLDESGSRDPSVGTPAKPKDHIYVLLAVGMYERQWRPFEREVSGLKLELADRIMRDGAGAFDLANCEVKSNWLRNPDGREKASPFLNALTPDERQRLTDVYLEQVVKRKTAIIASVIDKRYLYAGTTEEALHQRAYEFLIERIQHYMYEYHPRHQALVIMDDTSPQLNRAVAMQHAYFLRSGNWNMRFPNLVEYPFFTRSELSNGVQLADQMAYNVYRAFKYLNMDYPYFEEILPRFYQSANGAVLHGLKVWPNNSPLIEVSRAMWEEHKQKPSE